MKIKERVKVYCKDCMYCLKYHSRRGILQDTNCNHKSNVIYYDSYFQKEIKYIKKPKELNKNNDCINFDKDDIPI